MDEKMNWGFLILIFLFFMIFAGRGFGFGNCGWDGNNCGVGCRAVSPCQIERQEIIDSATTQFKVVDTARQTQEMAQAQFTALGNKIDFYAYQDLRDQLAQERTKNVVLENRVYADAQFNALTAQNREMYNTLQAQLSELSCNVAKRPPFYAQGFVTCGQPIPNSTCC